MHRARLFATVCLFAIGSVCRPAWATVYPQIYWSDRSADTIQRADADGSNVQTLVSGLGEPRGIDVDFEHGKVYWADNGTNKIQRANLDGTQAEDLVTTGLNFPAGIALDVPSGKMYWADRNTHKIQRANLDGTMVEDLVTNLGLPYFVTLDLAGDRVYWTDFGTDKIQRADLDGANVQDLVTTGLQLTRGIDLDLQGGRMYWADRGTDKLQRAKLDGSQIEDLVTILPPPGVDSAPHGVALDVDAGHMYWVDNGTQKVQRANLDGSEVVDLVTAANGVLSRPWQIVLDLGPELQAGDANQDLSFDQKDIIQLVQANRYMTGQPATWGEGDFSGAPGGRPGLAPAGDGRFDQTDIVAALAHGLYLGGPYDAVASGAWAGGGGLDNVDLPQVPVPEPSALALVGVALLVFLTARLKSFQAIPSGCGVDSPVSVSVGSKETRMAYDEILAQRIRKTLARRKTVTEKKMFGGIGFLLGGNMCVGVWKECLIARVGTNKYQEALTEPLVKEFDITGRSMRGWIMVEPGGLETDDELNRWVRLAVRFTGSLPAKDH